MSSFQTRNPATGEPNETFTYLTQTELEDRVALAHERFLTWRTTSHAQRAEALRAIASALRAGADGLARTVVSEMGKPLDQARAEVEKCAACCDYFAEHAESMLQPHEFRLDGTRSYAAFRPLGVVLAIMPWNFPYWQAMRALVPAIAAGNVMLLKHAESTTRCALELERIVASATGVDALLSTLVADHDAVEGLTRDHRVVAATLTGSERAGSAIARAAGSELKKVVLELGGSDPFIVLADADVEHAAEVGVQARFQNTGQSCIAAKRFIVERSRYGEFVEAFVAKTRALRVADPLHDGTNVGPVARGDLRKSLHEQVEATIGAGATLATGGRYIDGSGFYYEPTVVTDVLPGMRMFDEETFGPAAAIVEATDEAHAIALANASTFGLGSAIFTRDTDRAQRLAAQIESGMVFVNSMVASHPALAFGGIKRSGHGRELSAFGLHEFTNVQTVSMPA